MQNNIIIQNVLDKICEVIADINRMQEEHYNNYYII